MKSKLFWFVLALIIIGAVFSMVGKQKNGVKEFKPLEIEPGDEFTYINYENTMYVLNYIMEDVTGDETKDMIIAIGEKNNMQDMNANNIDVVIYEPNESKFYDLKLKKYNGSMIKIISRDLTGDSILDIALNAIDENGNIVMRIVSFENGEFKEIFKAKDNKGIVFSGNFIDGFKAYVKCIKYNKEINIDLLDRKENYIANGFFDESGRFLKNDTKITTSGYSNVDFVQLDGYFGIQTTQRILGIDKNDLLDEITVIWKYENGKWCVKEAKGNIVGNILY